MDIRTLNTKVFWASMNNMLVRLSTDYCLFKCSLQPWVFCQIIIGFWFIFSPGEMSIDIKPDPNSLLYWPSDTSVENLPRGSSRASFTQQPYKQYTQQSLEQAIYDLQTGKFNSLRACARHHGIPMTTLRYRAKVMSFITKSAWWTYVILGR